MPPSSFGIPDYDESALRATVYGHEMRVRTIESTLARMMQRESDDG